MESIFLDHGIQNTSNFIINRFVCILLIDENSAFLSLCVFNKFKISSPCILKLKGIGYGCKDESIRLLKFFYVCCPYTHTIENVAR